MLRCIQSGQYWPQAKVHGDREASAQDSEWPAVRAAHRQLKSDLQLETLDDKLRSSYEAESRRRELFRQELILRITRLAIEPRR